MGSSDPSHVFRMHPDYPFPPPRVGDDSILGRRAIRRALIRAVREFPTIAVKTPAPHVTEALVRDTTLWPGRNVRLTVTPYRRKVVFAVSLHSLRSQDVADIDAAVRCLEDIEGYARFVVRALPGVSVGRDTFRWRTESFEDYSTTYNPHTAADDAGSTDSANGAEVAPGSV